MLHKVARMTATPRSLNVEYPGRTDLNNLFSITIRYRLVFQMQAADMYHNKVAIENV